MPNRQHARRPETQTLTETSTEAIPHAEHKSGDELKSELDDIMDEIDAVLMDNAQEFVASYIQKGGE